LSSSKRTPDALAYLLELAGSPPSGPLLPITGTRTKVMTLERRVDRAFLVGDRKPPEAFILADVQLDPVDDELYAWALYVELARTRFRCEGALVVLTTSEGVRRWIARTIAPKTGKYLRRRPWADPFLTMIQIHPLAAKAASLRRFRDPPLADLEVIQIATATPDQQATAAHGGAGRPRGGSRGRDAPCVCLWRAGGEPVDLRRGHDGLVALVRTTWTLNPFNGHLFVFLGRRIDRGKILVWDRNGFVLYYKRLSQGRFQMPALGVPYGYEGEASAAWESSAPHCRRCRGRVAAGMGSCREDACSTRLALPGGRD
jgi:hypothetical protein